MRLLQQMMVHMNIPFSDICRKIYRTIGLISIVLLVINQVFDFNSYIEC